MLGGVGGVFSFFGGKKNKIIRNDVQVKPRGAPGGGERQGGWRKVF